MTLSVERPDQDQPKRIQAAGQLICWFHGSFSDSFPPRCYAGLARRLSRPWSKDLNPSTACQCFQEIQFARLSLFFSNFLPHCLAGITAETSSCFTARSHPLQQSFGFPTKEDAVLRVSTHTLLHTPYRLWRFLKISSIQ
jgi:hypothetical protein